MNAMEKPLGDICEFKYGKGLPQSKRRAGPVAVYGSNGQVGNHDDAVTAGSTIVIGRKGSIGEIHFSPSPCWPIDTTYYIDESCTQVDLRWLYHALKAIGLHQLNKAAAVPGLNRNDAYERRLWVPSSVAEQKRVAAILDKADAIRRKRLQALAEIDALLRSAYQSLVSANHPNFPKWKPKTFEELAAQHKGSMRTGPFGSDLRHSEFVDEGIAVLGIDNAVSNRFAWGGRRYITPEKYEGLRRYRAYPGDVIVTIMGTTGRSAVVPDDIPEAITTKHLATITLDRHLALPEFIAFAIHSDPRIVNQITRANKGAIMDGLNLGIIKHLEIALPPIEDQDHFARVYRKLNAHKARLELPEVNGDELFNSLAQRAFRGEL